MKISASDQVQRWLIALPPDTKKRVRAALRGLQNGRGDIKALSGELEGFCRLRIDGLRIVYSQLAGGSSAWNTPTAATWFMRLS